MLYGIGVTSTMQIEALNWRLLKTPTTFSSPSKLQAARRPRVWSEMRMLCWPHSKSA